jgi:hypothetical protein
MGDASPLRLLSCLLHVASTIHDLGLFLLLCEPGLALLKDLVHVLLILAEATTSKRTL